MVENNVITVTLQNRNVITYDIISLLHILNQNVITTDTKGILFDFTNVFIHYNNDDIELFSKTLNELQSITAFFKIALIIQNPKQLVFPILVSQLQNKVLFKAFNSNELAINWINR